MRTMASSAAWRAAAVRMPLSRAIAAKAAIQDSVATFWAWWRCGEQPQRLPRFVGRGIVAPGLRAKHGGGTISGGKTTEGLPVMLRQAALAALVFTEQAVVLDDRVIHVMRMGITLPEQTSKLLEAECCWRSAVRHRRAVTKE